MSSAVLEHSIRTPAAQRYSSAFLGSTLIDSAPSDAMFCGTRNASLVASMLVSALSTSAPVGIPVQLESHSTFGQVWTVNASTLFALDIQALPLASVSLSAEEHLVLRQAIWDSVEIVAPGRFVEL